MKFQLGEIVKDFYGTTLVVPFTGDAKVEGAEVTALAKVVGEYRPEFTLKQRMMGAARALTALDKPLTVGDSLVSVLAWNYGDRDNGISVRDRLSRFTLAQRIAAEGEGEFNATTEEAEMIRKLLEWWVAGRDNGTAIYGFLEPMLQGRTPKLVPVTKPAKADQRKPAITREE